MRDRRRWAVLLAIVLLLSLPACGESGEDRKEEQEPDLADLARDAEEERKAQARSEMGRAELLAADGKFEEARAALRNAARLIGETTAIVRVSDEIRAKERARDEERDGRETLAALARDGEAGDDEERLLLLAEAAGKAEAFLDAYPESPLAEEVRAGLEYARDELDRNRGYVEALEAARGHFSAGRHRDCVTSCDAALALLERKAPRELRREALRALTPEGMVFIPDGWFLACRDRERTYLPAFYVDRTEVTNARYYEFLKATGHAAPARFVDGEPPPGQEERPVTQVTVADALAFARWAKGRIPTEQEWERASRGVDGRAYPWGNDWDPAKGHFGSGGTKPVGSMPFDRSPDGVMDMAGNVMEITLPLDDPKGEHAGPVLKGGHWSDNFHPEYALTFARYAVKREHRDAATGFRCVRPAK